MVWVWETTHWSIAPTTKRKRKPNSLAFERKRDTPAFENSQRLILLLSKGSFAFFTQLTFFHILERGKKTTVVVVSNFMWERRLWGSSFSSRRGQSVTCYQEVVPPWRAERRRTLRVKSKLQGVVTPASEPPVNNITVLKNTFPSRKTQHTGTEAHLGQDIFRARVRLCSSTSVSYEAMVFGVLKKEKVS